MGEPGGIALQDRLRLGQQSPHGGKPLCRTHAEGSGPPHAVAGKQAGSGIRGLSTHPFSLSSPRHALKPPGLAAGPSSSNGCGGVCCGGSVGKGFSVVRPRPTCVPGSTAGFQLTQAFGLHVLTGTYRDSSGVWSTSAILCPANVRTGARVLVRSRSRGAGHLFKKAAGVCAGQAGEAMGLHGLLPRG